MLTRPFGQTGLASTILGFGGFHLLEIDLETSTRLLNAYLDSGGNYIETAANYGNGESERKIGQAISHRRQEYMLVSKMADRDRDGFLRTLDRSLENLQTDHLDVVLMHGVATLAELDQILGPGGAIEGFLTAREAGKADHVGLSMHGRPDVLVEALKRYPFEAVMTTINYYDRFNFPAIEDELLPLAAEKGCAVILMKPLADGLLWQSASRAFQYAFSRPVSVVVTGINTEAMLRDDLTFANDYVPPTDEALEQLYHDAPELGNYVCRQCGLCLPCPEQIDLPLIFLMEGHYDRQMRDGIVRNASDFALRDRLRFWFGNDRQAREDYAALTVKADRCTDCGLCNERCPYGIDVMRKLKIADYKLAGRSIY